MNKIYYLFKNVIKKIWAIVCAPVLGAIDEIKETGNLKANNLKALFLNIALAYFAPLTGAIKGLHKELRQLLHKRSD